MLRDAKKAFSQDDLVMFVIGYAPADVAAAIEERIHWDEELAAQVFILGGPPVAHEHVADEDEETRPDLVIEPDVGFPEEAQQGPPEEWNCATDDCCDEERAWVLQGQPEDRAALAVRGRIDAVPCDFLAPVQTQNPLGNHRALLLSNYFTKTVHLMKGKAPAEVRDELLYELFGSHCRGKNRGAEAYCEWRGSLTVPGSPVPEPLPNAHPSHGTPTPPMHNLSDRAGAASPRSVEANMWFGVCRSAWSLERRIDESCLREDDGRSGTGKDCPVTAQRLLRVPFLVWRGKQGAVAWLCMAFSDGTGECQFDTGRMRGPSLAQEFSRAADSAWHAARALVGQTERCEIDLRWWAFRPGGPVPSRLVGASLGAILALAAAQFFRGQGVDPACAVSAAIQPDGALRPVRRVAEKVQAAFQQQPPGGIQVRRVIVHPDNAAVAHEAALSAGRGATGVQTASTLEELCRVAVGGEAHHPRRA